MSSAGMVSCPGRLFRRMNSALSWNRYNVNRNHQKTQKNDSFLPQKTFCYVSPRSFGSIPGFRVFFHGDPAVLASHCVVCVSKWVSNWMTCLVDQYLNNKKTYVILFETGKTTIPKLAQETSPMSGINSDDTHNLCQLCQDPVVP